MLTEAARTILTRWEKSLEEVRRDQDLLDAFQREVFDEQCRLENSIPDFVADRALDFLAYAAAHTLVTRSIAATDEMRYYLESLHRDGSFIFFVRPCRELVTADGVRASGDLEWDAVVKIDAMVEYLLESNGLRYFPVTSRLLRERIRLVDNVIELAKRVSHESPKA